MVQGVGNLVKRWPMQPAVYPVKVKRYQIGQNKRAQNQIGFSAKEEWRVSVRHCPEH